MTQRQLKFKIPRESERQKTAAQHFVARAWPEGSFEQIKALFSAGKVRADEIIVTRPEAPLAAEAEVTVEIGEEGQETFGLPEVEALLWDDRWLVVEKPVGIPGRLTDDDPMDPVRFMADMLGVDREFFFPVWDFPAAAGGPWLVARGEEHRRDLNEKLRRGSLQTTWYAITERPDKGQGRWQSDSGIVDYATTRAQGGLAELQLMPRWKDEGEGATLVEELLESCAAAGFAVLGDARRGGYLVDGGIRLRLGAIYGDDDFAHSWPAPRDWWPDEPVTPPPVVEEPAAEEKTTKERALGRLEVSKKTLEIVGDRGGHPWVLGDRHTGSIEEFEAGQPVQLEGPDGPASIYALVDGTGPVVARYWSHNRGQATAMDDEVEIRLDEAIGRRRIHFRNMAHTDAFRVVYGEADGLPGLWVDRLGPIWRVVTVAHCAKGFRKKIYELLRDRDPSAMILEVEHLRDLRQRDELPGARIIDKGESYLEPGQSLTVREQDLRFRVEPWEGVDVGFFADQRDNRRQAVERAEKGQRWLNLFCHTGAFSVALAEKGVHTTNVDLSKRYLTWLDENFELNGLSLDLRENFAGDARLFLDTNRERFDGIIVDPPTAASSDQGFWSVRDDYVALLVQCFESLADGGSMLVCRNDKKARTSLEKLVKKAASRAGRKVGSIEDAPPADDFPSVEGFPEGVKFEGLWVVGD